MKRRQQAKQPRISGRQQGQAMVEMIIVLPVMGLLILGVIQFALVYQAKTTLNFAAYEAVRAGTLDHATLDAVRRGFARGLAPLYSFSSTDTREKQIAAFDAARVKVQQELDKKIIRIERINPTESDFKKFVPRGGNILNDNLRYRPSGTVDHTEKDRKGSIQNANLLHLRFTYWYPLYVPLINKLIFKKIICCTESDSSAPDRTCRWQNDIICTQDTPRIPLTAVAAMRMQTSVAPDRGYNCSQLVENNSSSLESNSKSCVQ
jgi:hypothetical protein